MIDRGKTYSVFIENIQAAQVTRTQHAVRSAPRSTQHSTQHAARRAPRNTQGTQEHHNRVEMEQRNMQLSKLHQQLRATRESINKIHNTQQQGGDLSYLSSLQVYIFSSPTPSLSSFSSLSPSSLEPSHSFFIINMALRVVRVTS